MCKGNCLSYSKSVDCCSCLIVSRRCLCLLMHRLVYQYISLSILRDLKIIFLRVFYCQKWNRDWAHFLFCFSVINHIVKVCTILLRYMCFFQTIDYHVATATYFICLPTYFSRVNLGQVRYSSVLCRVFLQQVFLQAWCPSCYQMNRNKALRR